MNSGDALASAKNSFGVGAFALGQEKQLHRFERQSRAALIANEDARF
jgi:hypothetical protein